MRAAVHGRPDEARSADAPYGARSCEPMRRRVFLFRPSAEPVVDVKNGTWLNGVSLIRGVAVSFDASRVVLCWLTWPRGVNSCCKVAITGGKLGLAFDVNTHVSLYMGTRGPRLRLMSSSFASPPRFFSYPICLSTIAPVREFEFASLVFR
ncbi:hypothetical protein B296_00049304 [Ensete ventricosum]|uniref:Uncharacterized protein n=1 Tax=Ensete ventricosum TaxID=4639 RepID=A0A426YEQ2_ENSVE|nr:hypothetical protein B296_00049304 [Ensete ventricosum]